ncbi:MAG: SRPBCC family protein [Acidimicrobiales bacterium]
MELNNEFEVSVPVAEAWSVLTDLERIAPCLPGAKLEEVEGDEYRGMVKVKVGPITAQYKGIARLGELDEAAGRIVLHADGRESRGQGNASAVVTATLVAKGDGTRVNVATDLNITGKVAQMGRGVLSEVSTKLMDQFAEALEADLSRTQPAHEVPSDEVPSAEVPSAEVASDDVPSDAVPSHDVPSHAVPSDAGVPEDASANGGPRRIESAEPEPIDLASMAGTPVVRRVGPVVGTVVVVLWLLRRRSRRRRRRP